MVMVAVEHRAANVSFAVRLLDDYSKLPLLVGRTSVRERDVGAVAIQNPSGYYVFTDLVGTSFTVRVENACYFGQEISVQIPSLDPRNPVVAATMKPKYLYPFPAASTLIRGTVIDQVGGPVEGARVTVVGSSVRNDTEADGRFVLYFGPVTEDDVVVSGTHRYVKVGSSTTLRVRVRHPSYATKTTTIGTVEESSTKLLTAPITLTP
jgi:hypothetical protein